MMFFLTLLLYWMVCTSALPVLWCHCYFRDNLYFIWFFSLCFILH